MQNGTVHGTKAPVVGAVAALLAVIAHLASAITVRRQEMLPNSLGFRAFPGVGLMIAILLTAVFACLGPGAAAAAISQPLQPKTGPGGRDYTHNFRVHAGGSGSDAWYVFEPTKPKPKKAPVAVVMHGYYEFEGYDSMFGLIRHTVRKGTIVIYPRWQTSFATPCVGPFDIEPCIDSTVNGIKGALAYLKSDRTRVQPEIRKTSYFGLSFGGIITADMANRYRSLNLPKPRAIFLDDPHDGGLTGAREPALDDHLTGIPAGTLFQCHSGAHGVFDDIFTGEGDPSYLGKPQRDGSCNSVFPKLTSIPAKNKDLVLTSEDRHGEPSLTSDHGVCGGGVDSFVVDAYDWGFCWKVWDALRSCAIAKHWCRYALGDTRKHRYIGTWSDGVPIVGLKIRDRAPIRAKPAPPRAPAPHRHKRGRS